MAVPPIFNLIAKLICIVPTNATTDENGNEIGNAHVKLPKNAGKLAAACNRIFAISHFSHKHFSHESWSWVFPGLMEI